MKIFILFLSMVLPLAEESDALKVRAAALLELVVKHNSAAALAYVEEESKGRFSELWGNGIPSYEITEVHVTGDQGKVIVKIERTVPFIGSMKVPIPMEWVQKNGEWFAHVPDWDRTLTPFGKITPSNLKSAEDTFRSFDLTPPVLDMDVMKELVAKEQERLRQEQETAARESQIPPPDPEPTQKKP